MVHLSQANLCLVLWFCVAVMGMEDAFSEVPLAPAKPLGVV